MIDETHLSVDGDPIGWRGAVHMKQITFGCLFLLCIATAYFAGAHRGTATPSNKTDHRVLYYVDPMHPTYKADRPGIAPDCGMELVPVFAEPTAGGPVGMQPPLKEGVVVIDADKQKLIGLQTVAAENSLGGVNTLRATGKVAIDESHTFSVTSAVDGWIREANAHAVGSVVSKDETLAKFYSPEFTALEQGYLVATERSNSMVKQLAAPGTQTTSTRLRNYGMGEKQIAEIAATRSIPENVDITSPASGVIVMRNVAQGQRFEKGVELYRIADYSHVWILAAVSAADAPQLRPGTLVWVDNPGVRRRIHARVSNAVPQVDSESRMMNVRLESDNVGLLMKPGMYVQLSFPLASPKGVSVPADAVLNSGMDHRVYVAGPNGTFEPRQVRTGVRFGDRIQIVLGLDPGERVVTQANFLVDSESRLRSRNTIPSSGNSLPKSFNTPALGA